MAEEAERRVRIAEERLEQAKDLRAALEPRPEPAQRHIFTTWKSFDAYRRDRLGAS
jgi:hypothetical protein